MFSRFHLIIFKSISLGTIQKCKGYREKKKKRGHNSVKNITRGPMARRRRIYLFFARNHFILFHAKSVPLAL